MHHVNHSFLTNCVRIVVGLGLVSSAVDTNPVLSAEANSNRPNSTQLSYDIDAALLYSDGLRGLSRNATLLGSNTSTQLEDPTVEPTAGYRTLGVRHLKLGLEWTTPRRLRAFVQIRPDAGTTLRREVDTRAGTVSTPTSDIKLLDLYELAILRDGAIFAVGVRDRLVPDWKVYDDILEFGLESRDPRKSFGAFLDMPDIISFGDDSRLQIRAAVIGGNNERHTERSRSAYSGDEAPARTSPYWGGVVSIVTQLQADLNFGASAALSEEEVSGGKVTNSFYSLGATRTLPVNDHTIRVGMDVRQSRSAFKVDTATYSDLNATSGALTASIETVKDQALLLALRAGTGTHQPATDTSKALAGRGGQGELGYKIWLGDGMEASALMTREWRRDENETGGQTGGFGLSTSDHRAAISRFAFQLAYRTGGNP